AERGIELAQHLPDEDEIVLEARRRRRSAGAAPLGADGERDATGIVALAAAGLHQLAPDVEGDRVLVAPCRVDRARDAGAGERARRGRWGRRGRRRRARGRARRAAPGSRWSATSDRGRRRRSRRASRLREGERARQRGARASTNAERIAIRAPRYPRRRSMDATGNERAKNEREAVGAVVVREDGRVL